MIYEPASWATNVDRCQRGAIALIAHARAHGLGDLGCYNDRAIRGGGAPSLHREGRAVDLTIGLFTDAWLSTYLEVLKDHHEALGVQQIIWLRRYWRCDRGDVWHAYTGTDPHTSHAHVELTWAAAADLTVAKIDAVLTPEDDMPTAEEIAQAIMEEPITFHAYDQNEEQTKPLRTVIGYVLMELQQIRRAP
jgi:hypothetical protein